MDGEQALLKRELVCGGERERVGVGERERVCVCRSTTFKDSKCKLKELHVSFSQRRYDAICYYQIAILAALQVLVG